MACKPPSQAVQMYSGFLAAVHGIVSAEASMWMYFDFLAALHGIVSAEASTWPLQARHSRQSHLCIVLHSMPNFPPAVLTSTTQALTWLSTQFNPNTPQWRQALAIEHGYMQYRSDSAPQQPSAHKITESGRACSAACLRPDWSMETLPSASPAPAHMPREKPVTQNACSQRELDHVPRRHVLFSDGRGHG